MKDLTLRYATQSDARAIAIVHVASWQVIYRGLLPDSELDALSFDERENEWYELINRGVKILLVEQDHHIVGFASIGASRDIDTDPSIVGEISAVYLLPDVWHQGIGKKLCGMALSELERMGFREVILWVANENHQARKFYTSIGFIETDMSKEEVFLQNSTLQEIRYHKVL